MLGKLVLSTNVLNVVLKVLIKMAKVIVTFKVMPESVEVDLGNVKSKLKEAITKFEGTILGEMTEEPIAFGLKAVIVKFAFDESKGSTDQLEEKIMTEEGIQNVEVVSVGRAMG
jgi:elongation factor 1-beta